MTEKMWFCYESDFAKRPTPVVYHGEKPSKKLGADVERSPLYDVPAECVDSDGSPNFGMLMKRFPPPQVKDDD